MAINLKKGQTINLEKDQFDLSKVTIGLGWDVMKKEKGFWSTLFSNEEDEDYDLDAIAFLLDENGKVANVGNQRLEGGHELFNGEYHLCSRSSNATFIGMVKRNEGDYVNIRHKNNPEKRKKLKRN